MKLSFMKNQKTILIILVVILITTNVIFGYLVFRNPRQKMGDFPKGMAMELSQEEIDSITSFFESTDDLNEIEDYCENNRMNCAYYCMNVDSSNEICSQMGPGGDRSFPS